jgi:hypothetical protein
LCPLSFGLQREVDRTRAAVTSGFTMKLLQAVTSEEALDMKIALPGCCYHDVMTCHTTHYNKLVKVVLLAYQKKKKITSVPAA